MCCFPRCNCGCSKTCLEKTKVFMRYWVLNITAELGLVMLLILNIVFLIMRPSVVWEKESPWEEKLFLVIIYNIEWGFFCLYAAHKIALHRVTRRRQIRLAELNAERRQIHLDELNAALQQIRLAELNVERDLANMVPLVERQALMEDLQVNSLSA